MARKDKFKRTQYLVDKQYQIRFVIRLISIVFAIALLSLLAAGFIMYRQMYDPRLPDQMHLIQALLSATLTLSIQLIVALPLIYFFGIRQSHRVVGPMKRIENTLDAIGNGDFSQRIYLRKGDVLVELAESINLMAERLERRSPPPKA